MSTRTERVFAAFQGPVLSVGAPVVHMYRAYTAELLLPLRWRRARSLGSRGVLEALSRATVRAEASVLSPPLRCASCGDVVALGRAQRTREGLPDDLECYSATLRSKCTSSKRHLRSPTVVLAVDVGGVLVCSEPFAVFAREPGRQAARGGRELVCCCSGAQQLAPAGDDRVLVSGNVPPSLLPPRLVIVVEVLWPQPNRCLSLPPSAQSLVPGIAQALSVVPGFLMQKCSQLKEMVVFVRAYRTAEEARSGSDICIKYAKNVIPNAINLDVSDCSLVLATFSNATSSFQT
eukprot:m51a1_g11520 hypothetical protein (291) ;mRNA; f:6215-7200